MPTLYACSNRSLFLLALGALAWPATASAIEPFIDSSSSLVNDEVSSGVAIGVADMNGDGLDDIVRLDDLRFLEIEFQQADGSFELLDYGSIGVETWSLSIGDADANGYNDIFVGGNNRGLRVFSANDSGTDFTATTLVGPTIFLQCSNFVDIDNNGTLDLFACDDNGLSTPYNNDGSGSFTYDPSLISAEATAPPVANFPDPDSGNYGSVWTDYDADGDLDLYIAKCRQGVSDINDPSRINLLYRNDGAGNFTEVAEAAGLRPLAQSWSVDFADIDNDGDFDAFLVNHDQTSQLYLNNLDKKSGEAVFTDITDAAGMTAGVQTQGEGIQSVFEDLDNDGFVDLLVTRSSGGQHVLFMNNGDQTFSVADAIFPTDGRSIQSLAIGDLNNDGARDIVAGFAAGFNNPSSGNPDRLLLNPGNDNNFFDVRLTGVVSNRTAAGARVELTGAWGTQTREVRAGQGYGITNSATQHFGIGTADAIETLTVRWPSGTVDVVDNPAINSTVHVIEGQGCARTWYLDADEDGFGDPASEMVGDCETAPKGYVDNADDCADNDGNNFPGNEEVCDEADNNCDEEVDEGLTCETGDSTGPDTATDTSSADESIGGDDDTPQAESTGSDPGTTSGDTAGATESDGCGCNVSEPSKGAGLAFLMFGLLATTRRRRQA